MFDLGLPGGWAAGGPAAEVGAPTATAPAGVAAPADADAVSPAGAFRDLIDALAIEQRIAPAPTRAIDSTSPASASTVASTVETTTAASTAGKARGTPADIASETSVDDDQNRDAVVVEFVSPVGQASVVVPPPAPQGPIRQESRKPEPANPGPSPDAPPDGAPRPVESRALEGHTAPPPSADAPVPDSLSQDAAGIAAASIGPEPVVAAPLLRKGPVPSETREFEPAVPDASSHDLPLRSSRFRSAQPAAGEPSPAASPAVAAEQSWTTADVEPQGTAQDMAIDSGDEAGPDSSLPRADLAQAAQTIRGRESVARFESIQALAPQALRALFGAAVTEGAGPRRAAGSTASTTTPVVVPAGLPLATLTASASLRMSSTGASESSAPAPGAEGTAPQIVQAIRLAWSRGIGEAQIRLDPRQFGDVSVSLRVENGQIVARLQAESPAVREWVQANQQTLKHGLAQHELVLDRLEVVASGEEARDAARRDARDRQHEAEDRPARRRKSGEAGARFEIVA